MGGTRVPSALFPARLTGIRKTESMPGFNDTFDKRREAAAKAKEELLARFRAAAPKPDDPEVQRRLAEQKAVAEAREARAAQRRAEKQAALEAARRAAEEEERRKKAEEAERRKQMLRDIANLRKGGRKK
jgi:type IV secretory pathway VirB10-like protein